MDILPTSFRDLNGLHKLEHACFLDDAWPLLDLIAVLTWPDVVRLKAMLDGQMIGFIAGDPRPSQGFAWIATLGVFPEYRRQGVARALLTECERRLEIARIRLCVRTNNVAAIRLYETADYQRVDIWRKYYHDGGDALLMEKAGG